MQRAIVLWLTGLSGSGKSTIAEKFKEEVGQEGVKVKIIDGDDIRKHKHAHLGFTVDDIKKNNELVAELCLSLMNEYDVIVVSVISPFVESRIKSREQIGVNYNEIHIKASLDAVIGRDVKGLYKKALNGEIDNFIGVSENTPYQPPENPELLLDTENDSVDETVKKLIDFYELKSVKKN